VQANDGVLAVESQDTLSQCVPLVNAVRGKGPGQRAAKEPKEPLDKHIQQKSGGRPMITLTINGKPLACFVDTGSEMTMVKETVAALLPGIHMQDSSRTLQGVTGLPKAVTAEADLTFTIHPRSDVIHRACVVNGFNFPGDLLLGMDLLQRLSFRFSSVLSPLVTMWSSVATVVMFALQGWNHLPHYTLLHAMKYRRVEQKPLLFSHLGASPLCM